VALRRQIALALPLSETYLVFKMKILCHRFALHVVVPLPGKSVLVVCWLSMYHSMSVAQDIYGFLSHAIAELTVNLQTKKALTSLPKVSALHCRN
jgi:hypothetical protein